MLPQQAVTTITKKNNKARKMAKTLQQRRSQSAMMKRIQPRIAASRARLALKKASPAKIKKRARKRAIAEVQAKFIPQGKKKIDLSYSLRERVEERTKKAKHRIDALERHYIPIERRKETFRNK
jgi:hypothetical protein